MSRARTHLATVLTLTQVKLYFMIGLPGETDADVLGIVETIKFLQSQCTKGTKHLAINCTISNFTPKPHTPFQWHTVGAGLGLAFLSLFPSAQCVTVDLP